MTLLVDVGNSNICFAFADNNVIVSDFRIKTFADKSYDEYYLILKQFHHTNKICICTIFIL